MYVLRMHIFNTNIKFFSRKFDVNGDGYLSWEEFKQVSLLI
jgi:hypothetical protein